MVDSKPAGSRRFLVGGNWKMNGDCALLKRLTQETLRDVPAGVQVVVAPPFPYLCILQSALREAGVSGMVQVAAQNAHEQRTGAFTGEVSAVMLEDLQVDWLILGHSERRTIYGEGSALIREKLLAALTATKGLSVIVCVGESLEIREAGKTEEYVLEQLDALLADPAGASCLLDAWGSRVVVAYEPIWAIGTGKVASPPQAQQVHSLIRAWMGRRLGTETAQATRIIYGGSVTGANCGELARQPDIDGFLVGGASLKPEFRDIIRSNSS